MAEMLWQSVHEYLLLLLLIKNDFPLGRLFGSLINTDLFLYSLSSSTMIDCTYIFNPIRFKFQWRFTELWVQ